MELNELLTGSPLFPIAGFEIRALTDVTVALENGIKALERVTATTA